MALKGFHSWSNPSPFNRRMCRAVACVGGAVVTLAACAPTAQAKVQQKPQDHVVLVGSTGAGKSSTANLLISGGRSDTGPAKVSHGGYSMTADIAHYSQEPPSGMIIVDTPGLGDIPPKEPGETEEQYKARHRQRSSNILDRISIELHAKGGLVLDVVRGDRITDLMVRHRQALSAVLGGSYSSSTVLVLTNVPEKYKYSNDASPEVQARKQKGLLNWVSYMKTSIEDRCGVRFATVLPVSNSPNLHKDHPANPAMFAAAVEDMRTVFCLPPETAFTWDKLISCSYKEAEFVRDLEKQAQNIKCRVKETQQVLDTNRSRASVGRLMLNTSSVGVAAVIAPAGAVVQACSGIWEIWHRLKRDELEKTLKDQNRILAKKMESLAQCNKGRTAEQLQAEAERLARLVFDD